MIKPQPLHLVAPNTDTTPEKRKRSTLRDTKAAAAKQNKKSKPAPLTFEQTREILQRPVAYYPILAEIAGSVESGVFLGQALHWTRVQDETNPSADGWFYKTQDEWFRETHLKRSSQETCRKNILRRGLMLEERRPLPAPSFQPRLYFKIHRQNFLNALWKAASEQSAAMQQTRMPHGSSEERRTAAAKRAARRQPIKDAKTTPQTTPQTTTTAVVVEMADATLNDTPAHLATLSLWLDVGVAEKTARELITSDEEEARRQVDFLPFRTGLNDPAASLISATRAKWPPPASFVQAEKKRAAQAQAEADREANAAATAAERKRQEEQRAAEQAENDQLDAHFKSLSAQDRKEIDDMAARSLGAALNATQNKNGAMAAARRNIIRKELQMPIEEDDES